MSKRTPWKTVLQGGVGSLDRAVARKISSQEVNSGSVGLRVRAQRGGRLSNEHFGQGG